MPGFTPGRRWQPAYLPFKKEPPLERAFGALELVVKGPLFGCRMCGNCLLQETALICPMECPKDLRNGPCGGSTSEACYVDPTRPCVWYKIYDRAFRYGREDLLLEVLPPLDWEKVGTSSWTEIFKQVGRLGLVKVIRGLVGGPPEARRATWDSIFRPVRQPQWWQGDSEYHAPQYTEPVSDLERRLKAGEFVIACEISPPVSASTDKLQRTIELIKPFVTVINFTDNASAIPRMTPLACSTFALQHGAQVVMQLAARERTRANLQSEVIGASALGVRNLLCVTGDSSALSPGPRGPMDGNDLDAIQMLWILRRMRDEGRYLDGRELKFRPQYFLGAAASPFSSEPRFQALREQKKVNAGAQFFQTNVVFDADRLEVWLNEIAKRNILDKVYIMIGLTPLKSFKMANYMNKVPGVSVPPAIIKRMDAARQAEGEREEGVQIALELIEKIRTKQGVSGLHIMPVGWEEILPRIISEAGLSS